MTIFTSHKIILGYLVVHISRYGDFCAHDNNDTTDYFTPCACAQGNNNKVH